MEEITYLNTLATSQSIQNTGWPSSETRSSRQNFAQATKDTVAISRDTTNAAASLNLRQIAAYKQNQAQFTPNRWTASSEDFVAQASFSLASQTPSTQTINRTNGTYLLGKSTTPYGVFNNTSTDIMQQTRWSNDTSRSQITRIYSEIALQGTSSQHSFRGRTLSLLV